MLVLSLDYPPNDGGISRLAAGLVDALLAEGRPVEVVTFAAAGSDGIPRPEAACVEVDRRRGRRDWQVFRAVRKYLRAHGRDAPVLATVWNPEATIALMAGAKRVSILAHGNEVLPYRGRRAKAWLRRRVLGRARVVICNSRFTEELVRQACPRARTAVLNPAVDRAAFVSPMSKSAARARLGLDPDELVLLTVARVDPIKGHETVLRALAQLESDERARIRYCVIGKGAALASLQTLAGELNVAERVDFLGFVPDERLPLWYAAADLFVLCSVVDKARGGMEGFGMALTEAQAAGLPVIGTRSGGIPDAVREGEGGWLIAERDAGALATHLRRLIRDPEAFHEQGRLGAERVRREMTWDRYAGRIIELAA